MEPPPGESRDWGAIARAALAPARPRLAEAWACVGGPGGAGGDAITDPREAWEALATRGLIPPAWSSGGEARRFARPCAECRGRGGDALDLRCEACEGQGVLVSDAPLSVRACVALAADAPGVATAEALAREGAGRMRAWGEPEYARVVWCVTRGEPWVRSWLAESRVMAALRQLVLEGRPALRVAALRAGRAAAAAVERAGYRASGAALADLASASEAWRVVARAGERVPLVWGATAYGGAAFAEVPDPLEPWVAVWTRGYAAELAADAVVLFAPEAD